MRIETLQTLQNNKDINSDYDQAEDSMEVNNIDSDGSPEENSASANAENLSGNKMETDGTTSSSSSEDNTETDESETVSGNEALSENSNENMSATEEASTTQEKEAPKKTQKSVKASIRDLLVFREINNDKLADILPPTCKLLFEDPDELHNFKVEICPDEGYWTGGKFTFDVNVTEQYNFEPPKVKCLTKIWHPNINEEGGICLSILRSAGIDENGWNPARQLKDVILGINSLFTDLLNFHDPLNSNAAEMFQKDPAEFTAVVKQYIRKYARN